MPSQENGKKRDVKVARCSTRDSMKHGSYRLRANVSFIADPE